MSKIDSSVLDSSASPQSDRKSGWKAQSDRGVEVQAQSDKLDSILLPYQKRWVSDKSPVKFYEKSRRIGVTWAEALDNVLTAATSNGMDERSRTDRPRSVSDGSIHCDQASERDNRMLSRGMDIWYIGYNKDMAREYIDTCADWAKKLNQAVSKIYDNEIIDEDKKILSYSITFHSGFKITALSGRPSNLRGKQGKAVIDEAAFHDDLKETMKAALAFLIWGGKVAVISTHFGADNVFNEYIKDIRAGRLNYSLHRTTFDDAINDGLYERVMAVTKRGLDSSVALLPQNDKGERFLRGLPNSRPNREEIEFAQAGVGVQALNDKEEWIKSIYADYNDSADEELRCIPTQSNGAYFTSFLVESCMEPDIPIIRFNPPSEDFAGWNEARRTSFVNDFLEDNVAELLKNLNINNRHFIGEDFARSADLSVFWILCENKDLTLSTPFIIELRNAPHKVQEQIAHYVIDRLPRFNGGGFDARGNGEYLAESCTERYGEDLIISVKASETFYLNAFPKLKAALEDKTITLPKSADILADFRSVKVVKGVPKIVERVNEKDSHLKRHGDSVIACLLGVYARSELGDYEQVDYEKVVENWNL